MTVDFNVTKDWILAGNAIFTVYNGKGKHYTYRVKCKKDEKGIRPPVWFVSLLTGPDNYDDYTYLGCLNHATGAIRITRASRMTKQSTPVRVVEWALRILFVNGILPPGYGIKGEGRCGRCGRKLTHPDGVSDEGYRKGFGPECFSKITGG
jgi:hypothetical protein